MSVGLVADTSAFLAAIFAERRRDAVLVALAETERAVMSSCCVLEASIVVQSRLGPSGQIELERLLEAFTVETVPFTAAQATLATDAWQRFGKGRHPAGLNIVDCCSYALAVHAGLPLLAVGDDFPRTDVEVIDLSL